MRNRLLFLGVLILSACRPAAEGRLPEAGTVVVDRESGVRYRVTWSGNTTYNQGACPEVNTLCVHLVGMPEAGATGAEAVAAELAVPFSEYGTRFDASRR